MPLVTQAEFARLEQVNRSSVNRWLAAGRIQADENGMIDSDTAHAARLATESPLPHHQARKSQFDEAKQAAGAFFGAGQGSGSQAPEKTPQNPQNNAQQTPEASATTAAATATGPGMPKAEQLGLATKLENFKIQKIKAETDQIALDTLTGAIADLRQVDAVLIDTFTIVRTKLESMPDRLAPGLAGHKGDTAAIHRALDEGIRDLLHDLAHDLSRKAAEI